MSQQFRLYHLKSLLRLTPQPQTINRLLQWTVFALFAGFLQYAIQARSQDLEKGGGYFERVRSVQTTLTRIFIVLESVSHSLSENWDEISRKAWKFKDFFCPKSGGLQNKKTKKVFTEIETDFSAEIGNFNVFFRPKSGGLHKKLKVFTKIETDFSALIGNPNVWGGLFSNGGGGYFQFFTKNRPQNHQNGAILHTSQANGGTRAPPRPPPPPPGYATDAIA